MQRLQEIINFDNFEINVKFAKVQIIQMKHIYFLIKYQLLLTLFQGYGHIFIHKVQQRHVLARNYFSRLPGMAEHIRYKANEKPMVNGPAIAGQQVPVQQKA